jgi:hypothetical protein
MPFHRQQASASSASNYVHHQHLMYPPATHPPPIQHTPALPHSPLDSFFPIKFSAYQHMTPPYNPRPLDMSPHRPCGQYLPWASALPLLPPPSTPLDSSMEEDDPINSIIRPSTPEWFGFTIPGLPAEHMLQPPKSPPPLRTPAQSPYKYLPPLGFSSPKTPELIERDWDSPSTATYSSVDSSPSRVVTPPMPSPQFPETRSRAFRTLSDS